MSVADDLQNMYAALCLEKQAVARYADHQSQTEDPMILSLLQGLMRNEVGHEEHLIENIHRLGGDPKEAEKCPPPALPQMVYEGAQMAGQKTNLAMLRADMAFEEEATKLYGEFSKAATDEQAKELFAEFSRAERGHVNGLRALIKAIESGSHEYQFFCPVCGWPVEFGTSPTSGSESRCKMCGVLFAIKEKDGDFVLERKS